VEDYEVSADVYLNTGDIAGVMGRVNHVGTGYGFIPKGYYLQLEDNGKCRIIVTRGKGNKKEITGDAEQQAIIRKQNDESEGGEKVLGEIQLSNISHSQWHNLKLQFEGSVISAFVDEKQVLQVTDSLYTQGMAGLIAGGGKKLSTPFYDNLLIKGRNTPVPKPSLQHQDNCRSISLNNSVGEQSPLERKLSHPAMVAVPRRNMESWDYQKTEWFHRSQNFCRHNEIGMLLTSG
jgi:galactosylceramidase